MSAKKIVCKDTNEVARTYKDYLQTKHWQELRYRIAKLYNFTCNDCGEKLLGGYEIHHLTYKNIGNEKDKDLVCLCRNCHQKRTDEDNKIKAQKKKLSKAKLSEKLKHAKDTKQRINMILRSRKTVVSLFYKHFDMFLVDLEELERWEKK